MKQKGYIAELHTAGHQHRPGLCVLIAGMSACASLRKSAQERRDVGQCHGASKCPAGALSQALALYVARASCQPDASAMDGAKVVTVEDSTYHAWMAEVRALKPNKRKNWKATLFNQQGEGTRVRYNEASGHLENYSPAHASSFMKKYTPWLRVGPSSSEWCASQCTRVIPITRVGAAYMVSDEVGQRTFQEELQNNHTGHHQPRHHPVQVPTAPGEPCQG